MNKPENTSSSAPHRLYYLDTYLYELQTKIIATGCDPIGDYFIPLQTLFHPQGGGQPDDEGYITYEGTQYPIYKLVEEGRETEIKHYYRAEAGAPLLQEGKEVHMYIDKPKRLRYAAYHTAGHLIADIVEKIHPDLVGIKGNHFPEKGAVIFARKDKVGQPVDKTDYAQYDLVKLTQSVEVTIIETLTHGAEVKIDHTGPQRTMQIGEMKKMPCGGTHLRNLNELKGLAITKVAFKKREGIKVSYHIES